MIFDKVPADADPFGSDNAVVFAVVSHGHAGLGCEPRTHGFHLALTGLFCDSNYAASLRSPEESGLRAILVKGSSSEPVLSERHDHGAESGAPLLCGKKRRKRLKLCRHRQGRRDLPGHWTCGRPSAFRQRDLWRKRTGIAGRGALALMGAKNLKAVVVKGSKRARGR